MWKCGAWLYLRWWARLEINHKYPWYGDVPKWFWNFVPLYTISLLIFDAGSASRASALDAHPS